MFRESYTHRLASQSPSSPMECYSVIFNGLLPYHYCYTTIYYWRAPCWCCSCCLFLPHFYKYSSQVILRYKCSSHQLHHCGGYYYRPTITLDYILLVPLWLLYIVAKRVALLEDFTRRWTRNGPRPQEVNNTRDGRWVWTSAAAAASYYVIYI